jgi:cardiolipin synthase
LRLNFEFNLECYHRELAEKLAAELSATMRKSRPITLSDTLRRNLFVRLRDGFARLFSPYL